MFKTVGDNTVRFTDSNIIFDMGKKTKVEKKKKEIEISLMRDSQLLKTASRSKDLPYCLKDSLGIVLEYTKSRIKFVFH